MTDSETHLLPRTGTSTEHPSTLSEQDENNKGESIPATSRTPHGLQTSDGDAGLDGEADGAGAATTSVPPPVPLSNGAVIRHLNKEIQSTRDSCAAAQSDLVSVQSDQREIARSLGEARESRTRAEEQMQAAERMLARRDRHLTEVRDRLRQAEHRARTLGTASRAKGTRLRELEAKLGEQRRLAARQEAAYETLRTEWEHARAAHRTEIDQIKTDNALDLEQFQAKLEEQKERWKVLTAPSATTAFAAAATTSRFGSTPDSARGEAATDASLANDGVAAAVTSLCAEQEKAARDIAALLDPVVEQARALEDRDRTVEFHLLDALQEIRRLRRLALAAP